MRAWAVALAAGLLVGGAVWAAQHLVELGAERQRAADAAELERLKIDNQQKEERWQTDANRAKAIYDDSERELAAYRASAPLHGGLCASSPDRRRRDLPAPAAAAGGAPRASTAAADLQPLPAGDPGGGPGGADVRHLLDVLAGRADRVANAVREWRARWDSEQAAQMQPPEGERGPQLEEQR